MPSAEGKEIGQYSRPALSLPQPAFTPCSASPTGTPGTLSRGIPPWLMCLIFSSRVARERRFLMRASVGTLELQYAPCNALQGWASAPHQRRQLCWRR